MCNPVARNVPSQQPPLRNSHSTAALLRRSLQLFGSCALSPLMLLHKGYYVAHRPTLSACWKSVALIGALNGLQSMRHDSAPRREIRGGAPPQSRVHAQYWHVPSQGLTYI